MTSEALHLKQESHSIVLINTEIGKCTGSGDEGTNVTKHWDYGESKISKGNTKCVSNSRSTKLIPKMLGKQNAIIANPFQLTFICRRCKDKTFNVVFVNLQSWSNVFIHKWQSLVLVISTEKFYMKFGSIMNLL